VGRITLLAGVVYLIILAGVGTLNGAVVGLALPLALYLLAGLWRGPESLDLVAERTVSTERISPGGTVRVEVTVTNRGEALEQILLRDPLPPFLEVIEGASSRLVRLPARGTISWSYTVRGRRGSHTFEHLEAVAEDRFGLLTKRALLPTTGSLLVLPGIARARHIAIRPRQTRVYSGVIPARQGGAGIEFFGVREFQPGDSPRRINWRVSARHDSLLYASEYEQERAADVGIILDGRRSVNEFGGGRTIFEASVTAAVAVSSALLMEGNRVGLYISGKRTKWTSPGYGKYQRERIMQDLAHAETGESHDFRTLIIPRRLFPPTSQIILISPLGADDISVLAGMRARGYPLMVISPDPVSFEARGLPHTKSLQLAVRIARLQREMLLREVRRIGVQAVNWDTAVPFEQVARSALSRPPAFLHAIQRGGARQ
jgi:uncharacterized protein (DUF58 family)